MSANQDILDSVIQHDIQIQQVEAGMRKDVLGMLEKLEKELVAEVSGSDLDKMAPRKRERLEALLTQTKGTIGKTYETIAAKQAGDLAELASIENTATVNIVNGSIGADVASVGMTAKQAEKLAGNVMIEGRFPRQFWADQDAVLAKKFEGKIREGMLRGESVDQLVGRIRGTKAAGYTDGIMVASRREAEALVRTSVQTVANEARLATYQQNHDVIKGVQWVSTFDGRTTKTCMALSGLQWTIPDYKPVGHAKQWPGPIAHWNCRSTQIPVTRDWSELASDKVKSKLEQSGLKGKKLEGAMERTRASMDGQVAEDLSFDDWLAKKPDDFVDDLLGRQRARLWREQKITLPDLTDQRSRELTLQELRELVEKNKVLPTKIPIEGQDGLSLLERKLLEESMAAGLAEDQVLLHFVDEAGERLTIKGLAPTVENMQQLETLEGEVTMLLNILEPGGAPSPSAMRLFWKSKARHLKVVDPHGAVIRITKEELVHYSDEHLERLLESAAHIEGPKGQALVKAAKKDFALFATDHKAGTITPIKETFLTKFDALTQKPAPFVDWEAFALEKAKQEAALAAELAAKQAAQAIEDAAVAEIKTLVESPDTPAGFIKILKAIEPDAKMSEALQGAKAAWGVEQQAIKKARSLAGYRKAKVAGKLPTDAQQAAFDALEEAEKLELEEAIEALKAQRAAAEAAKLAEQQAKQELQDAIEHQTPLAQWIDVEQWSASGASNVKTLENAKAAMAAAEEAAEDAATAELVAAMAHDPQDLTPEGLLSKELGKIFGTDKSTIVLANAKAEAAKQWSKLEDEATAQLTALLGQQDNATIDAILAIHPPGESSVQWLKKAKEIVQAANDAALDEMNAVWLSSSKAAKEMQAIFSEVSSVGKSNAKFLAEAKQLLAYKKEAAKAAAKQAKALAGYKQSALTGKKATKAQKAAYDALEEAEALAVDEEIASLKAAMASQQQVAAVAPPGAPPAIPTVPGEGYAALSPTTMTGPEFAKVQQQVLDSLDGFAKQKWKIATEGAAPNKLIFFDQNIDPAGAVSWYGGQNQILVENMVALKPGSEIAMLKRMITVADQAKKGLMMEVTEEGSHWLQSLGVKLYGDKQQFFDVFDDKLSEIATLLKKPGLKIAPPVAPPPPPPPGPPPVPIAATVKPQPPGITLPHIPDLKKVKDLPGSTRPSLMVDKGGGKWVMKQGLDPEHLRSEALTDELYRIAGAPVPRSGVIETAEGPVKLAEFLEGGQTVAEWLTTASKEATQQMRQQIQRHFVMDALLGNWDVAGLGNDNLFIVKGIAYRIDNGGGLLFRAQGQLKTNFGAAVTELDTLRNPQVNSVTAGWFRDIADEEIHRQIRAIVDKRQELLAAIPDEQLRHTIATRIDWLEARLPKTAAPKRIKGPAGVARTIGQRDTAEAARKARINGVTVAGDRGDVEDMNVLVWSETDVTGAKLTKLQLKVTPTGSQKVTAVLDDAYRAADAPSFLSASGTQVQQQHPMDDFWSQILSGAKTIGTHAQDGNYTKETLDALWKAEAALKKLAGHPEADEMAKHYLEAIEALKGHIAGKTAPPVGSIKQFVPTPKVSKKQPTLGKPSSATPFKLKRTWQEFRELKIERGHATMTGTSQITKSFRGHGEMWEIDAGPGVKVRFVPSKASRGSTPGQALAGDLELTIEGDITPETLEQANATLRSLGIDIAPPTPEYEELLYLHKTIYLRNQHTDDAYRAIWNSGAPDGQKVKEIKQWVKERMGITLPDAPTPDYNPGGYVNMWGEGIRRWDRWDITRDQIRKEMEDYRLHHSTRDLEGFIAAVLDGGGEFTTTTGRLRTGVNLGRTGGMSSDTDVETGGANYFFTRIKHKKAISGSESGIYFKIETLARSDAISFDHDAYGSIDQFGDRKSSFDEWRQNANHGTNETDFKHGLSMFSDVDFIKAGNAATRKNIIETFRKAGWEKWPDGRKLEDVIQ